VRESTGSGHRLVTGRNLRWRIDVQVAFRRETLDLEFANGERRRYERVHSRGHGAVMIAAIPEPGTVLLIREYCAGA